MAKSIKSKCTMCGQLCDKPYSYKAEPLCIECDEFMERYAAYQDHAKILTAQWKEYDEAQH